MDDRLSLSLVHCAGWCPLPGKNPALRLQAGELTRTTPAAPLPVIVVAAVSLEAWVESAPQPLSRQVHGPVLQCSQPRHRTLSCHGPAGSCQPVASRRCRCNPSGDRRAGLHHRRADRGRGPGRLARHTAARGIRALREAIAGFYAQRYRLSIDPERILITPGGSGALLLATSLLVDPGKHWLLADPGYPCNRHFLRLVEGAAQLVPVGPEVRYQLTADLVARHWDKDSVGALVASPANPTGTLLSREELGGLSRALKERGGHLVVDEIYHGLTYGVDASSVLEVDDDAFVLNSFSKYFGMTGWRLGWLVAPQE